MLRRIAQKPPQQPRYWTSAGTVNWQPQLGQNRQRWRANVEGVGSLFVTRMNILDPENLSASQGFRGSIVRDGKCDLIIQNVTARQAMDHIQREAMVRLGKIQQRSEAA